MTNLEPFLEKAGEIFKSDRIISIAAAVLLFIVVILIIVKINTGLTFESDEFACRLTGPAGWKLKASPDKRSVEFQKKVTRHDQTIIKLECSYGNPYGKTPLEFVENSIQRSIVNTYGNDESNLMIQDMPQIEYLQDNREWAKMSFSLRYNEFYMYYVTQDSDDRVFILSLVSKGGANIRENESAFYKTLHSMTIRDVKRASFFEE